MCLKEGTQSWALKYSPAFVASFLLPKIIRDNSGGTSVNFIFSRINISTWQSQWEAKISISQILN